ncbi:MAG: PD-(D/E)XK nuclease family protein, partial [Candidatus Woesearchaeota archaeon]
MDKIIKDNFDAHRKQGTRPVEIEGINENLFGELELLNVWRNYRKGLRWKDGEGNTLMGAVDDMLEKEGKLIVLDYKTRGFPLKKDSAKYYQSQLDIYNLLLRKNGYDTEDYAYLLFYHPK